MQIWILSIRKDSGDDKNQYYQYACSHFIALIVIDTAFVGNILWAMKILSLVKTVQLMARHSF